MKFKDLNDKLLFLTEINRVDLISDINEKWSPDKELTEIFLKKRKDNLNKHKDFRRSQSAKMGWRHNRYNIMKGIKIFHKSTEGKRFHRNLARFLVLKDRYKGMFDSTQYNEALVNLSSYETHILLELEYYHTLSETLDYYEFVDYSIPIINTIKSKIREKLNNFDFSKPLKLNDNENNILYDLVYPLNEFTLAVSNIYEDKNLCENINKKIISLKEEDIYNSEEPVCKNLILNLERN